MTKKKKKLRSSSSLSLLFYWRQIVRMVFLSQNSLIISIHATMCVCHSRATRLLYHLSHINYRRRRRRQLGRARHCHSTFRVCNFFCFFFLSSIFLIHHSLCVCCFVANAYADPMLEITHLFIFRYFFFSFASASHSCFWFCFLFLFAGSERENRSRSRFVCTNIIQPSVVVGKEDWK